jgi:hypothetical protein
MFAVAPRNLGLKLSESLINTPLGVNRLVASGAYSSNLSYQPKITA